jgi:hypothetical protein
MPTTAQLRALSVDGIAAAAITRRLFGPRDREEQGISPLITFSFCGLALSLFAIERFPSLVAAIAASP